MPHHRLGLALQPAVEIRGIVGEWRRRADAFQQAAELALAADCGGAGHAVSTSAAGGSMPGRMLVSAPVSAACQLASAAAVVRSEEHTSGLQLIMCLSYAVFCLKKKTKT